jgi:predicted XRE-type DNA-binding protein
MSKEAFESNCGTNSEPFALQNLGDTMEPEFSENCILIIDPGMQIHNRAYAVVRYTGELYFRQYIERGDKKFLVPLSTQHDEIELKGDFEMVGCVIQQKQRKQKGWSQKQLAEICNLDRTTIGALERDDYQDLGIRKVERVLSVLGMTLSCESVGLPTLDDLKAGQKAEQIELVE